MDIHTATELAYKNGYEKGTKDTVEQILKFVEQESKFIAGVSADMLLDRIVKEVKKIEVKGNEI